MTVWRGILFLQQERQCAFTGIQLILSGSIYRHVSKSCINPSDAVYNSSTSAVRTAVEWLFGDFITYFKFLDFKKNLKIGLSQVSKLYIVHSIMKNALTCLYGNGTSQFFDLDPPSLEDYFA